MGDIKSNEREFMSQVTSWLNEFLKEGSYPFEVASSDPSVKWGQYLRAPEVYFEI
jgi:hypothetical protein